MKLWAISVIKLGKNYKIRRSEVELERNGDELKYISGDKDVLHYRRKFNINDNFFSDKVGQGGSITSQGHFLTFGETEESAVKNFNTKVLRFKNV